MVIIKNFKELKNQLSYSFSYGTQGNNKSRVAALLFAQPNSFTKDEILASIDYFHIRSGSTMDFFCIGYQDHPNPPNLTSLTTVNGQEWFFNPLIFNNLRMEIQTKTKWRYSGNVELVLFNSYLDENNDLEVDFSDAISIDLRKAKDDKLISSVGEVIEKIIETAENISTENPSKEMSFKLIGNTGKKSLVNILFNLLPKSIKDEAKKIYLFGTTDLK
jgi:hypothetical protein